MAVSSGGNSAASLEIGKKCLYNYFSADHFSPDRQRHSSLELRIRTGSVILLIIVIASLNIITVSVGIGIGSNILVRIMLFSLVDTQVPSRSQKLRVKWGVISHFNPNGNISILEGNSPEIILLTGHH